MELFLLVAGKIIVGNFIATWIFRSLGRVPNRMVAERTVMQYVLTFTCAAAYLFYSGLSLKHSDLLVLSPIFLVGIIGSTNLYIKLQANAVSLSRFAVFEMLVAVIPLTLSATLLGEWVALTDPLLLFGFVLCILGAALYFIYDVSAKLEGSATSVPLSFYGYGIAYMVSAGLTAFLMNVWAKAAVPAPLFLAAWYAGTLVGSGLFYLLSYSWKTAAPTAEEPRRWSNRERLLVFAGGLAVFANMGFLFGSFQKIELLVVAPFYITGDIIGPVLIGMLFFKEWKALRKWGYLFFGIDFVGTCIVGLARALS